MGCFNLTCAVSRLPITAGLPIRAFVLAKPRQLEDGNLFYSGAFFIPLTTGIQGSYDDYGRIEDMEADALFDVGANHFLPGLAGKYDELLDRYERREPIKIRYYRDDIECDIEVAFIREDVYQKLQGMHFSYSSETVNPDYVLTREGIVRELEDLQGAVKEAQSLFEFVGRQAGGDAAKQTEVSADYVRTCLKYPSAVYSLALLFYSREGDLLYPALKPYRDKLVDMIQKQGLTDETVDLAMDIARHLHLNHMLNTLAILWQPSTNMVGQMRPYDLHRTFNDAINSLCDAGIKEARDAELEYEDRSPKFNQGWMPPEFN